MEHRIDRHWMEPPHETALEYTIGQRAIDGPLRPGDVVIVRDPIARLQWRYRVGPAYTRLGYSIGPCHA